MLSFGCIEAGPEHNLGDGCWWGAADLCCVALGTNTVNQGRAHESFLLTQGRAAGTGLGAGQVGAPGRIVGSWSGCVGRDLKDRPVPLQWADCPHHVGLPRPHL